jgi:multiple sugar transport system permease protein
MSVGNAHRHGDWGKHAILWALIIAEFFPLYMMLQGSLKDNASFISNPWIPEEPTQWLWSNWVFGLKLVGPYLANTVVVAGTGTMGTLICAILGAYFFARYELPYQKVLWPAFMVLMMLPTVANLVPLFSLLKTLGLLNTLSALILVGMASAQAFNIYVLRNFYEDIPREYFEAAEIDGANHFHQLYHVVIPMSGSILGTLGILAFLTKWNEFLLPLVVLRDQELFTLGVGLIYLDGEYVRQWGQVMAAYLVASVPLIILFLFTVRLFIRGLSSGGIKG